MDQAVKTIPTTSWWIKSDGVDVTSGLMQSNRQEWYGDVDLGDGELQGKYEDYINRLKLVDGLCRQVHDQHQRLLTCTDLRIIVTQLEDDRGFINKGLCIPYHAKEHNVILF